jgi:hypothetical protein
MSYLLDFDELSFLEKYGIEPNTFDKDTFLYEYKLIDPENSDIISVIAFSLLDKTFSYHLSLGNRTLVFLMEKELSKIKAENDKMIFVFEKANEKTITFSIPKFELKSIANIFSNE